MTTTNQDLYDPDARPLVWIQEAKERYLDGNHVAAQAAIAIATALMLGNRPA